MRATVSTLMASAIVVSMVCIFGFEPILFAQTTNKAKSEAVTLQGIWTVIPLPPPPGAMGQSGPSQSIRITDKKFIYRFKEEPGFTGILDSTGTEEFPWITDDDGFRYVVIEETYKINAKTTPMQIDLSRTAKNGKLLVRQGIYTIKGDTLSICIADHGAQRPTECKEDSAIQAKRTKK